MEWEFSLSVISVQVIFSNNATSQDIIFVPFPMTSYLCHFPWHHNYLCHLTWHPICVISRDIIFVPFPMRFYVSFDSFPMTSYLCHCIVLYCIMRPYTDDPIGPLSYRHSSGVVRNPHSALAEWGIFNLRSISPQGTHFLIARRRNSITSVLASISWMTCLSATCEPRTINLSITGERITFTM